MEVGLQEQSDLVIGATISLLSALLTFLLTSIYQSLVANREREWQLEDRKKQREQEIEERNYLRRQQVLARRLEEVEENLNQYIDIGEDLIDYEHTLLASLTINSGHKIALSKVMGDRKKQTLDKITPMLSVVARRRSSVFNLGDDELTELSKNLDIKIFSEVRFLEELETKTQNNSAIDVEQEHERIRKFYNGIMEIRKVAIKRIDHLSGFLDIK